MKPFLVDTVGRTEVLDLKEQDPGQVTPPGGVLRGVLTKIISGVI